MEKIRFKRLLFDIACSAVACDGHIDEREIKELHYIDKSTTYFEDIDMSRKLERFVENFKDDQEDTIKNIIVHLKDELLNPVEEMLVLEIVLRLIHSDTKIDAKEIEYIQSIRSNLSIDDEVITQRFGEIDFLVPKTEKIFASKKESRDRLGSTDLRNIENMYMNLDHKKDK